ncbi:MAG: rhomboid family intramembrane serine protease [Anaerolineae bacterium]|nr:rhomboid family intramembrane serine protease [Anaerolineae bacterium]
MSFTPDPNPLPYAPIPTARPRYVWVFLVINVILFAAMTLVGGSENPRVLILFGANFAPLVASGEYWRLVTANFLHIGLLHIAFNTYALYALGRQVESLYGHPRFVTIYLLSGVSGAALSFMLTQGLSAGASTSLFGLFGALVVYFYRHRRMYGEFGRQQLISLGIVLLINVVLGLTPGSRIDNWGHAGGFIGGAALAWFLCPQYVRADPFVEVFRSVVRPRYELSNGYIADANSLGKQILPTAAFIVGLVALIALATALQS